MRTSKDNFKFLFLGLISFLLISACSYQKTALDIGSLFDPTWDFSKTSELTFDENYVEVKNGQVQLKPLDLIYEGDDFDSGTHVGSYSSNGLKLTSNKTSDHSDIRNIIPNKLDSLVAYYRFDNSWNDLSVSRSNNLVPSNSPTFSSTEFIAGTHSADFDGISQFANTGNIINVSTGQNFTFSGWFMPRSFSNFARIFDNTISDASGKQGLACWIHPALTRIECELFRDGVDIDITYEGAALDRWFHLAIVGDGTNLSMYIDGLLIGTTLQTSNNGVGNYTIGARHSGIGSYFDGLVDEFAFYSTDLNSSEVLKIYKAQSGNQTELSPLWTPKWNNIVGYWKMDGNWQDSSGKGSHGTGNGGVTFSTDATVGNKSGFFDGVLGKNVSISSLSLTGERALSFWAKLDSAASAHARVFSIGPNQFDMYMSSATTYAVTYGTTACNAVGTSVPKEVWHHFLFSHDGTDLRIYLNNKLMNICTIAPSTYVGPATIGATVSAGSQPWIGEIDDIAIWNSNITASELSILYNRQKQKYAGHYDSEVIDLGISTSNWPDLSWSTSLPFGKELVGDFDNDGSPNSESSSNYPDLSNALGSELVGYWPFNERQLDTIAPTKDFSDLSGNNLALEESGGISADQSGKLGRAIFLDGIDDYIEVGDQDDIDQTTELTSCVWVKHDSETSDHAILSTTNSSSVGFLFFRDENSGLKNNFYSIYINDGVTAARTETLDQSATAGSWNHVCFTYLNNSPEGLKIYLNGALVSSNTTEGFGSIDSDVTSLFIGTSSSLTRRFHGSIDDLVIWTRNLSSSEIQALYRRGANRIKFQVKSCVDSTCECKSLSTSPVGSATDCDGDTIVNALDFDDIHKAEFIGPGGDGTTYYSELFNRKATDLTFNCGINSSDSDSNICVNDEITFGAGPRPTGPVVSYDDLPLAARPIPNPYFQYRVYMEADSNTACDGSPCLPELTSVNLNPGGTDRYYGSVQEVKPNNPLAFTSIQAIKINADTCATYQLSPDGTNYFYVSGGAWVPATEDSHRSTKLELENNIVKFSQNYGPGLLHIKVFLETNSNQTSSCRVRDIDVVSYILRQAGLLI